MRRKFDHSFMREFLRNRNPRFYQDPEGKSVVDHDRWDQEILNAIYEEVRDLANARDSLEEFVETGRPAMGDLFYSMVKAEPEIKPPEEVWPSHFVNRAVQGEVMATNEWNDLRSYVVNDPVGAAIACSGMEPKLEVLFDMLHEESKQAQDLQTLIDQLIAQGVEEMEVEGLIRQAMEAGDDEKVAAYMDQKELIRQAIEKLQNEAELVAESLENAIEGKSLGVQMALKEMLLEARKNTEYSEVLSQMWGLEPGTLTKMPAEERIALAKKIDSAKFRKIVDVFGPSWNTAFSEQMRKYIHSHEETYELSLGNNLPRVLPGELLTCMHPILRWDFARKFYSGQLLQYELRGDERIIQGGMIWCEDGSASMAGDREVWAKAIALCILHIARLQERAFYGIHFGSVNQLARFDFRDTSNIAVDDIMNFASHFFNGGTDFHTPLAAALDVLEQEYAETGRVNGDIIFCTDGEAGLDDEFIATFKARQFDLGFRVFGVAIDCARDAEPLATICDGRVITVQDILSGRDVKEIFRDL